MQMRHIIGKITIGYEKESTSEAGRGYVATGVSNLGEFTSTGEIELRRGGIQNAVGCMFKNSGTITITNRVKSFSGILNRARKDGEKVVGDKIINTGPIYVRNEGGHGINNHVGAEFENRGNVIRSKTGTAKGKISGNKAAVEKQRRSFYEKGVDKPRALRI